MRTRSAASLTLLVVLASLAGGTRGTDLQRTFHVAPAGDDAGPGTAAKPFATLRRARDAVRALIRTRPKGDVRVLVRGGTYYLPQGLAFGPEDSGSDKLCITYAARPGEVPVLVGGLRVTGWRRHKGSIRQATVPAGAQPDQLFENGRRLTLARAPNDGYFRLERPAKGNESRAFVYSAGDLDPAGWDITGGRVFLWAYHDWFSKDVPLAGVDAATRTVTMGGRGFRMRPGNRYFVQNVLALLDRPGECVIDLRAGSLYAWPRSGGDPGARALVASTAGAVLAIEGTAERPVRNVHFEGLDVSISNGDGVRFDGAADCSVRFCRIENARECGVLIAGHARRITLYGNEILRHGLHGVHLQGLSPGRGDVNHHHVVENNHIHHCGRLVGHGYGVRISQSGHNRVVHNDIHHMPRYGTTIKGVRYQVLRKQVKGVTWANRHDFLHSRKNLLAYNHIHHVNLDSQDTGAMESWGPGRDNVYDHNLIHDVGNTRMTIQSGMYLDDATDYFVVTNNVIYDVAGKGGNQCIYAKGVGNRIENNVLVVSRGCRSAIRSLFMADERCDHHVYRRNIVYIEEPAAAIYDFNNWTTDRLAECDQNVYFHPGGELTMAGRSPGGRTYDAWRKAFGGKFDRSSITADPRFADFAGRDFRLKDSSPALKLGFRPIDTSRIGLKADFPKRFAPPH